MRAGWYRIENHSGGTGMKIIQHMVFQSGPRKGEAKGLKVVCSERFGPEAVEGTFSILCKICIFTLCVQG